LTLNFTLKN